MRYLDLVLILNKFNKIKNTQFCLLVGVFHILKILIKNLKKNIENVEWLCSTIFTIKIV